MHRTLVLHVVGLTPDLLGDATPNLAALAREGARPPPPHGPPGGHLLRAGDAHDRAPPAGARRRRQRLVLPRPVGGLALAPVEPAGRGREGLGGGPAARSRVHLRQALLVVQHVQHGDLVGDAAPDVSRRRAEDPRRLHPAGGAPRRAQRAPRASSRSSSSGGRRPTSRRAAGSPTARATSTTRAGRPSRSSTCPTSTTTSSASGPAIRRSRGTSGPSTRSAGS